MKPDVITQYCVYNDYPIFRHHLQKYRDQMNKIILYPSRHHGFRDFEAFSKEQIKETWVDPVPINYGVEDWRQAETIPCLQHLESDWVWFREQDFFVDNWDKFYEDAERLMTECDMFGWQQNDNAPYIHPCCLFIKRELLNKTSKDFSAHPEIHESDHFATITKEARELGAKIVRLQDVGYKNWENAYHLGGMSYPYQNWSTDRIFGVGNLEAFYAYNYYSRLPCVPQDPHYIDLSYEIEDYLNRHITLRPEREDVEKWEKFYV